VYQYRVGTQSAGAVGPLLCSSKREVRYFTGVSCFLEPGVYVVFAMAFNHWSSGMCVSLPSAGRAVARIGPLHFLAEFHKTQLNLGIVVLCLS